MPMITNCRAWLGNKDYHEKVCVRKENFQLSTTNVSFWIKIILSSINWRTYYQNYLSWWYHTLNIIMLIAEYLISNWLSDRHFSRYVISLEKEHNEIPEIWKIWSSAILFNVKNQRSLFFCHNTQCILRNFKKRNSHFNCGLIFRW